MSAQVSFYRLSNQPGADTLLKVLPPLLEKVLASGKRALVKAADEARLTELDTALWLYGHTKFLPHGTAKDPHPTEHPVFIALDENAPNGATVLVTVDGLTAQHADAFERVLVLFDPSEPEQNMAALAFYDQLTSGQSAGAQIWQQTTKGWEKLESLAA